MGYSGDDAGPCRPTVAAIGKTGSRAAPLTPFEDLSRS